MALGGVTAGLNVTVPSGASQAGTGQADIRSIKTTFQQVLDSEHIFPDTGGAGSGAHRLGSARAFYGASSALSSSDTDGRLYLDSTNSRLHHAGSSNTMLLGGQFVTLGGPAFLSQGTAGSLSRTTSTVTQAWMMECGRSVLTTPQTLITLQHTYVAGAITVSKSFDVGSYTTWTPVPILTNLFSNKSTFIVDAMDTAGSATTPSDAQYFNWTVVGIVAL